MTHNDVILQPGIQPRPLVGPYALRSLLSRHVYGFSNCFCELSIAMNEEAVQTCCDFVLEAIEDRLVRMRGVNEVDGEDGEVLLRLSTQMCQWVLLLEPFITGARHFLDSLIDITRAIEQQGEQRRLRTRGRRRILISESQIRFYLEHNFNIVQIANLFGCSRRTVERIMREFNITVHSRYSCISDMDLRNTVAAICSRNPNLGEKSVDGLLRSQGITVQRHRIRQALHAVDPEGVQLRLREFYTEGVTMFNLQTPYGTLTVTTSLFGGRSSYTVVLMDIAELLHI